MSFILSQAEITANRKTAEKFGIERAGDEWAKARNSFRRAPDIWVALINQSAARDVILAPSARHVELYADGNKPVGFSRSIAVVELVKPDHIQLIYQEEGNEGRTINCYSPDQDFAFATTLKKRVASILGPEPPARLRQQQPLETAQVFG